MLKPQVGSPLPFRPAASPVVAQEHDLMLPTPCLAGQLGPEAEPSMCSIRQGASGRRVAIRGLGCVGSTMSGKCSSPCSNNSLQLNCCPPLLSLSLRVLMMMPLSPLCARSGRRVLCRAPHTDQSDPRGHTQAAVDQCRHARLHDRLRGEAHANCCSLGRCTGHSKELQGVCGHRHGATVSVRACESLLKAVAFTKQSVRAGHNCVTTHHPPIRAPLCTSQLKMMGAVM